MAGTPPNPYLVAAQGSLEEVKTARVPGQVGVTWARNKGVGPQGPTQMTTLVNLGGGLMSNSGSA